MNTTTFNLSELFTVIITKSVDTTKNPPFLLSFKIVVDQELQAFLNGNKRTNFDHLGIRLEPIGGFLDGPFADIDIFQNLYRKERYVPLVKAINEEITFAFNSKKSRDKSEGVAIKAIKETYKEPIDIFLKAKEDEFSPKKEKSHNGRKRTSKSTSNILWNTAGISIAIAIIVISSIFVAGKIEKAEVESKKEEVQEQQQKDLQLKLVAEELNIAENKVRYVGRTLSDNFSHTYSIFKTDEGEYSVEFENGQIKSILKEE